MTYQNLGYWVGQANDTSTGRHPTGWTSGQRWSETASEWLAMYDQSQSDLAAANAALAAMTTDRNTWKSRADQAWGASRVWNNGESWEAAYTRVLPAGSGGTPVISDVTGAFTQNNANTSYQNFFTWTIPTTGYWVIHLQYSYDNGAGQADLYTRWQSPDGTLTGEAPYIWTSRTGVLQAYYTLLWGAGGIVRYQARSTNGGPYLARHGCTATFVPTQAYPH
jgi:hypothetical protein